MSKANLKFLNNDEGVSPIVATLVLIVVAIVGAAAVGLIMGSFSSSVSKQANSNDAAAGASTQIIMGGSTTVQPLADILAAAYSKNNTGVKISVQGGGSGAGEIGTGMGTLDIGMASEYLPAATAAKYPDIQTTVIGGSGVVLITGKTITAVTGGVPTQDIADTYAGGVGKASLATATSGHVYTRSGSSGTADAMGSYLFGSSNKAWIYGNATNTAMVGEDSNGAMLAAIQADAIGVGYVDYGFANGASNIVVQNILGTDGTTVYTPSATNIKNGLKDFFAGKKTAGAYDILCRPLCLLTNGNPSTIQQSIISWFQQPQNNYAYASCGYYSMADIGV